MTNGRSGRTASWVAAVVSVLILFGSVAVSYSNLNSELTAVKIQLERVNTEIEGLHKLKEDAIRRDAKVDSIEEAQERLYDTMGNILEEMKDMNKNITDLKVKIGK
jgi:predicted  nucleic acid-binding Zn-ribbon protein